MGYYSEVGLALAANGINKLRTQLAAHEMENHIRRMDNFETYE